jgi:hypothetical protein
MTIATPTRQHEGETSVYQLFMEAPKRVEKADAQRIAYLEEKQKLAMTIGLSSQAVMIAHEITREKAPTLDTPPLTKDEIMIWRSFLPTEYAYFPNSHYGKASEYRYDAIPHPVMAKWKECIDEGVFTKYEIWTPEVRNTDPALVGYIGEHCYMLARWAESDANFVTFGDVKRKLVGRFIKEGGPAVTALVLAVIMALLSVVVGAGVASASNVPFYIGMRDIALVTSFFTVPIWLGFVFFDVRRSRLMRAIYRHTFRR